MKSQVLFGLFVLVLVCASAACQCPPKPVGASCNDSTDCRPRYCYNGKCTKLRQVPDNRGRPDTCRYNNPCPPEQVCIYREVQCFTSPCPAIVECADPPQCS